MNLHATSASVSVVLIGRFSPDKFLPEKLLAEKMITKSVASAVSITTLVPGQTVQLQFALGDLLVAQDRFQLVTKDAPYIRISDFAIKAATELAPDSVVTAFGINRESHYDLQSVDARNNLGIKLAPPSAWGPWGESILKSMQDKRKGTRLQGGVMFLQLRELFEENDVSGWLDVSAMPSTLVPGASGVFFKSNHHHQLTADLIDADVDKRKVSSRESTLRLLELLAETFDESISRAKAIFERAIES